PYRLRIRPERRLHESGLEAAHECLEVRVPRTRYGRAGVEHVAVKDRDGQRRRLRLDGRRAIVSRLDRARRTAAVASQEVAVVAILRRCLDAVAAGGGTGAAGACWLDRARGRAAIVRDDVSVVAGFEAPPDAITTDVRVADGNGARALTHAGEAGLEPAARRAAVAVRRIAIVALLAGLDEAVTARGNRRARRRRGGGGDGGGGRRDHAGRGCGGDRARRGGDRDRAGRGGDRNSGGGSRRRRAG